MEAVKTCKDCGQTKVLNGFPPDRRKRLGVSGRCKLCKNRNNRERYRATPEHFKQQRRDYRNKNLEKCRAYAVKYARKNAGRYRLNALKRSFGISEVDYNTLLEFQGGGCALCDQKTPIDSTGRRLAVDHDIESGNIRGLLCFDHNTGLGKFKHDLNMFAGAALTYLLNPPAKQIGIGQKQKNK